MFNFQYRLFVVASLFCLILFHVTTKDLFVKRKCSGIAQFMDSLTSYSWVTDIRNAMSKTEVNSGLIIIILELCQ